MSKNNDKALQKCDELIERLQELKKAVEHITTVGSKQAASNRTPMNSLGVGWSSDPSTGAFHHSTHGIISTSKHKDSYYQINHGGRSVGRASSPQEAGLRIKNYIKTLKPSDTGSHNMDPMAMKSDDVEKSNYGPKKAGLYNVADNVNRKANNTGETAGEGKNTNVKAYSSKPGQLSAKQQASLDAKKAKKLSGAVRQYTPEQIAAYEEAKKLKKNFENSPWINHNSFPNADEEVQKLQQTNPSVAGENALASQLASMMNSRAMLNPYHRQPTSEDMLMAGERMGLGVSDQMIKSAEQQWQGSINNWMLEASKPISSRFESPEEEEAYWASIKVSDRDDGKSGY